MNQHPINSSQGFTLIELIMVIVILGVLSAFALPKFADLSGTAETAALEGAMSAVKSASGIVHAQALATNTTTGNITLEGATITLAFGYPDEATIDDAAGFSCGGFTATAGDDDDDFDCAATAGTPGSVIIALEGAQNGDECFIYTEATSATVPPTIVKADGSGVAHILGGIGTTVTCT